VLRILIKTNSSRAAKFHRSNANPVSISPRSTQPALCLEAWIPKIQIAFMGPSLFRLEGEITFV
jgi:hypothetical protein